jgi:hypothetical protein
MLKLALKTLPLFAVIVGFAMALGAYMNYSGVRGAYFDLIASRMEMVLDDVATNVQSAVSVGIPPAEQSLLPSLLARLTDADPLIRSIQVVAPDGRVLFTSGSGTQGANAESAFRLARTVTSEHIDRFGSAILSDALPAGLLAAIAGSLAAFLMLRRLHRRADRAVNSNTVDTIDIVDHEIDKLRVDQTP